MDSILQSLETAGSTWLKSAQNGENGTFEAVASVLAISTGLALAGYRHSQKREQNRKTFDDYGEDYMTKEGVYNVAIVGAGPSGSTLAYYLGVNDPANFGKKVALIDKKKFPRDKHCGDAVARMACNHLKTMGVYDDLIQRKKGVVAKSGGFVSPCGKTASADSAKELGEPVVTAIKRWNLDYAIFQAATAKEKGNATACEEFAVKVSDTTFDPVAGIWSIKDEKGNEIKARLLICADGANSSLAGELTKRAAENPSQAAIYGGGGYLTGTWEDANKKVFKPTEPQGECTRHYLNMASRASGLEGCDGMVFYPPKLLPGYCAVIKESDNDVNFCTYVIPGGELKKEDASKFHEQLRRNEANYPIINPYIPSEDSTLDDPNQPKRGMQAGPLRLGALETVPKTFGNHLLVIGDAAGFIDPLTGEGIQYAMESGHIASGVVVEAFKKKDLSSNFLSNYQRRWGVHWGAEFWASMKMSLLMYYFPRMVDASAFLIEKKGPSFLAEWAEVMTGTASKTWFLHPHVAIGLSVHWLLCSLGINKVAKKD